MPSVRRVGINSQDLGEQKQWEEALSESKRASVDAPTYKLAEKVLSGASCPLFLGQIRCEEVINAQRLGKKAIPSPWGALFLRKSGSLSDPCTNQPLGSSRITLLASSPAPPPPPTPQVVSAEHCQYGDLIVGFNDHTPVCVCVGGWGSGGNKR